MPKKTTNREVGAPKKPYIIPHLKVLISVKTLTLKTGSSVDGFGTFA